MYVLSPAGSGAFPTSSYPQERDPFLKKWPTCRLRWCGTWNNPAPDAAFGLLEKEVVTVSCAMPRACGGTAPNTVSSPMRRAPARTSAPTPTCSSGAASSSAPLPVPAVFGQVQSRPAISTTTIRETSSGFASAVAEPWRTHPLCRHKADRRPHL